MSDMNIEIIEASFHRNGVMGLGFFAVLFDADDLDEPGKRRRMIASLFDAAGACAVYDVSELAKGNVTFARGNSWRGDVYEEQLRPLVKAFQEANGTNRMGPFSMI